MAKESFFFKSADAFGSASAPVLYWDKDKSRVSSQGYAVVVVLVSKVNQLQVRRLEAE